MEPPRDRAVRIVCFDLGGVLIKLRKSWVDVCLAVALELRGETASDRAEDARRQAMAPYVLGQISHDEWAARTARALDGAYTPDELTKIHDAWLLGEYAGVAEIIDELNARGMMTACLSNTNHAHWLRLNSSEYPGVARLGALYASHLLGCGKPDEAIYRAFEQSTGTGGADVLFFDDIAVNVDAARALGWNAERIDPSAETAEQIRSHLIAYGIMRS